MTRSSEMATITLPGALDIQAAIEAHANLRSALEGSDALALEIEGEVPGQLALQLAFAAVAEAQSGTCKITPGPALTAILDSRYDGNTIGDAS